MKWRHVSLGLRDFDHGQDDVTAHVRIVRVDFTTDDFKRIVTFILETKEEAAGE